MEEERVIKDQLIFSRSFSDPITDRVGMEQVMGIYAHRASARLHKHQPAITVKLPEPTVDPVVLTRAAKRLLPQILVGAKYARAGVVVMDLQPWAMQETFDPYISAHEAKQIGPLIQQIRSEHGVKSIGLGVAGLQQGPAWEMRSEMMSPGTRRFGKNCSPSNPSKRGVGICHGPGCLVLLPFQELRLRFELAS